MQGSDNWEKAVNTEDNSQCPEATPSTQFMYWVKKRKKI